MSRTAWRKGLAACAVALAAVACNSPKELTLENRSGGPLQPYGVVNAQRVPVGDPVRDGTSYAIDPDGFNMVFYDPGVTAPAEPNGLAVQADFGSDPRMILTRVYRYVVKPGQEGGDPANAPQLHEDHLLELDPATETVVIRVGNRLNVQYVEN